MEANVFISKIKAEGSNSDVTDLHVILKEYKSILETLSVKDRCPFSLNVLCMLCRNLGKIPSWKNAIDNTALLNIAVECSNYLQIQGGSNETMTLGSFYHIHKHFVSQALTHSPELVLALSYKPFEVTDIKPEFCKIYWNILAGRITYIEKVKTQLNLEEVLQKLSEDIIKVIRVYDDTVQFCSKVIDYLVKKLHCLFSDTKGKELSQLLGQIFKEIHSKNDLGNFKKLPTSDLYDIYIKLNDCLYAIAENCIKNNVQFTVLNTVVQTCISIVGHQPDLLHCFQIIYLNGFCSVLNDSENISYKETILTNFVTSCETAERLGYTKAICLTYPYINHFLRQYIEYNITTNQNKWKKIFSEQLQISSLKLMIFLMEKLEGCSQMFRCENCSVKTGLHDALRLSFLVKYFVSMPIQENMSISKTFPLYFSIALKQYEILNHLSCKGCINNEMYYKKLQTTIHNTAILLNKSQDLEFSSKLFELYVRNEILHCKSESDLKNISRGLLNKSICELDCKNNETAMIDAYLSLVFSYPEAISTNESKHMSVVMEIKDKELRAKEDAGCPASEIEEVQMMTALDACAMAIESKKYGNLIPFFCNLKFSEILKYEFQMYAKLWPSILPIAGVWKTLHDLTQHDVPWLTANDDCVHQTLYEIMLQTPTLVRSIHNDTYSEFITKLIEKYEERPSKTTEKKIIYATILFMKAEYDLTAAKTKHGWKFNDTVVDLDQVSTWRTISQEHEATKRAIQAVDLWTEILKDIHTVKPAPYLKHVLQVTEVFVPQLLHLDRTVQGLQLAHACCAVAQLIDDKSSYLSNASAILYHANIQSDELTHIIATASKYCAELIRQEDTVETALVFLCDCAIYYFKLGKINLAARLIQYVQVSLLDRGKGNLELALGHLFEAEVRMLKGSDGTAVMFGVLGVLRHYLGVNNRASAWSARRWRSLHLKLHITGAALRGTALARARLIWMRAKSAAGVGLPAASAVGQARMVADNTNPDHFEDNRVKIDNYMKYILGVQPYSHELIAPDLKTKSEQLFVPRQDLETMLEYRTSKKCPTSPIGIDLVQRFKHPDFMKHDSTCQCYACQNLNSVILTCHTAALEACTYFKAKEYEIAQNYFAGSLESLALTESKLKAAAKCVKYENYLVEIVSKIFKEDFNAIKVRALTETAFFELSQDNYATADEHIITIYEILQEQGNLCPYLKNEVLNLVITASRLRKSKHQKPSLSLEAEFDNLKLSPAKHIDPPKTPESKVEKPPTIPKIKVDDEEIPHLKRRVIKLNLDEPDVEEKKTTKTRSAKRNEFKMPPKISSKPVLENVTPIPTKKKTQVISEPSKENQNASVFDFATPKPKNSDKSIFFTAVETPSEQFFTPMSSIKTYEKKSFTRSIVKNLESEFMTPKSTAKKSDNSGNTELEIPQQSLKKQTSRSTRKVETGTIKALREKRTLLRDVNLEKNEQDKKLTRSSRLRQPVKLDLDN